MSDQLQEAEEQVKALLRLVVGRPDKDGTTIHRSMNPYGRTTVKEALKYLAKRQGIADWLDVEI